LWEATKTPNRRFQHPGLTYGLVCVKTAVNAVLWRRGFPEPDPSSTDLAQRLHAKGNEDKNDEISCVEQVYQRSQKDDMFTSLCINSFILRNINLRHVGTRYLVQSLRENWVCTPTEIRPHDFNCNFGELLTWAAKLQSPVPKLVADLKSRLQSSGTQKSRGISGEFQDSVRDRSENGCGKAPIGTE